MIVCVKGQVPGFNESGYSNNYSANFRWSYPI